MRKPAIPVAEIAALGGHHVTIQRRRGKPVFGVLASGRALGNPPTVALWLEGRKKPTVLKCEDVVGIEDQGKDF